MKAMASVCIVLASIIPAVVFGGEGEATPIPWGTLISLALVILTAVAGGLLGAMRKALKASYEGLRVLTAALEDNSISDGEIKKIIKASVAVHDSWKVVIKKIGELVKKA